MRSSKHTNKVKDHQLATVLPSVWKKLKEDNEIDRKYFGRVRKLEIGHRSLYPAMLLQSIFYKKKIDRISFEDHPPIFILGLWRSGTTHLHYMFSRDSRYGYLKNHQAFTFNLSLLSMDKLNRVFNIFVPKHRPQDNVGITLDDPAEEEQPFSTITTRSSIHTFFFPRNQSYFKKYHLFEGITDEEKDAWAKDYLFLLRNIALYSKKQDLVLKNPHNTGRVEMLLKLFPDAKFIFIHRNPYRVFHSTKILYDKMISTQFLQEFSEAEIEKLIIEQNKQIMDKYLQDRHLIPEGNLVEVKYKRLEEDPLNTVEEIYGELNLPEFKKAKDQVKGYIDSVSNYHKNKFDLIPKHLRDQINTEWNDWFEEFTYDKIED